MGTTFKLYLTQMKTFISPVIFTLLLITSGTFAQIKNNDHIKDDGTVDYKARAIRNLPLVLKDSVLWNMVSIKDDGLYIYDKSSIYPEFVLYWKEVGHFLRLFYNEDYHSMQKIYKNKGDDPFYLNNWRDFLQYDLGAPISIGGLRVALDPGHFAGNWDEAVQERRYLKVKATELGEPATNPDKSVYEAQLTDFTVMALADTLRRLGAEVHITREPGKSAVGKPFNKWYVEDFQNDLKKAVVNGEITSKQAQVLLAESKPYVFENFYKYLDFVNRSRSINDFNADVTLVIHYNADEDNERFEQRYSRLTNDNFSMVFIPGAYVWGELYKQDARLEMVRLLVSSDLEESERLARLTIKKLSELGVPPIPRENDLMHPKKYCVDSQYEGVYHRNMYLTRSIESPIAYVEALYQDNKKEFPLLLKRDHKVHGVAMPKRCAEVAYKLLENLQDWVKENETLPLIK